MSDMNKYEVSVSYPPQLVTVDAVDEHAAAEQGKAEALEAAAQEATYDVREVEAPE